MRALRLLLIVDALALAAASTISDPILADVAKAPALLIAVIVGIACLSGDLVPPRRRLAVACSALTIVAAFPFLLLPGRLGPVAAAAAIILLQVLPLLRGGRGGGVATLPAGLRSIVAALSVTTMVLLLVVAVLVWYGSTYLVRPPTAAFGRAPYLTLVSETRAQLAWQAKQGQGPVVIDILGPDGHIVAAPDGTVNGLRPGTRYVWSADIAGRSRAAGAFRTAPSSTAAGITLVAFGDYGSGNGHEYAVGRLAAAVDPALALSSGDNAYLLAAPPLLDRAIFAPLRPLLAEAPMVAALGEHDLAWRDGAAVISALRLPGHQYAVQYGPVQVVVLGLEADASAVAFAARSLGHCQRPCPVRFVLTHRPIAVGNPILPLLRSRHVAAIIAGHLHRYERQVLGGVLELTVGTGGEGAGGARYTPVSAGAQKSLIAYGFLRIEIARDSISYHFVDERGRVLDRYARSIGA